MRGQTTLDFATGISVFLLAVLFVFAFVPGVLTPFTASAQEETVTANRVADLVVKDIVADAGEPYLLDGHCTAALLNDSLTGSGCGFDGSTLETRLSLPDFQSINITIRGSPNRGNDELLCWNTTSKIVVNASNTACDFALTKSNDDLPSSRGSVVTARRIVSIGNRTASMEVNIW